MCHICKRISYMIKDRHAVLRMSKVWDSRASRERATRKYPDAGPECDKQIQLRKDGLVRRRKNYLG